MKKASRLVTACAWVAILLAHSGAASAAGGRITFSGALVNPSCQLETAVVTVAGGGMQRVVRASHCGNAPFTHSTIVPMNGSAANLASGMAQVSSHQTPAGTVLEVSYH